jgi:hypothetical protein
MSPVHNDGFEDEDQVEATEGDSLIIIPWPYPF